jgi:hypothetical protein
MIAAMTRRGHDLIAKFIRWLEDARRERIPTYEALANGGLGFGELIRRHLADSRGKNTQLPPAKDLPDACRFGFGVILSRIGRAVAPDHIGLDDRQTRACRSCSNPS